MRLSNMITAVDTHVCGEPGRVIVGGVLDVPGATMFENRLYLEEHADALRKRMLREPRGYPAANCNLILPPTHPEAQAGYVIMEQVGYPPMSGTNTIAVTTVLLETSMIPMVEPITELTLESPAGLIRVRAEVDHGKVKSVALDTSSRRLFAIGGFNGGPLGTLEEATLTEVPSANAGGPYTVMSGSSVGLNGSGGSALSFAWDLDGDLIYETAGQNPTFSAVGLLPGVRTIRVRAMDENGAYSVASTTVAVTAAVNGCAPRPNVSVATARLGDGQMQATLTAQTNASTPTNGLISVRFMTVANAAARLNGSPVTVGPTFNLPPGAQQATLLIDRHPPDQTPQLASTVSFAVTDACGEWKSFVGGGPGAF